GRKSGARSQQRLVEPNVKIRNRTLPGLNRARVWRTRPPVIKLGPAELQSMRREAVSMRIGFIGLGNMGGPMALNIIRAGHDVTVNDVRREAATPHLEGGAKWAQDPREVATHSEVIMTSLPGPRDVDAVALGEAGIIHGARPGSIYVDLSTNSPTVIR